MKFTALSLVLIIFQSLYIGAEVFKKIATYRINNDKDVKQIFMTRYVRSNWLDALMVCQENGMELARIESLEEYSKIQRALKIHSIEFKDNIFVDGKSNSNVDIYKNMYEWEFVTNNELVNQTITDLLSQTYYLHRKCLAMTKINIFGVKLAYVDCTNNFDFLCQQLIRASENDVDIDDDANEPIVVDVKSRMFKKLGRFQRKNSEYETEFFMSNFPLSPMRALRFCKHFNMKLVEINSQEELKHLKNLLSREGTTARFSVGHVAERVLENFIILDHRHHCFGLIFNGFQPEIKNYFCDENEHKFICEGSEEIESSQHKNQDVRTTGMKYLATFESGDIKKSFFLSDKVTISSWFEAFLYCKSLNMNLYNPDDSKVNDFVIDALHSETVGSWDDGRIYFIGAARFGSESFFYSLTSGREIENVSSSESSKMCLGIEFYRSMLKIEPIDCKPNVNLECLCEFNGEI